MPLGVIHRNLREFKPTKIDKLIETYPLQAADYDDLTDEKRKELPTHVSIRLYVSRQRMVHNWPTMMLNSIQVIDLFDFLVSRLEVGVTFKRYCPQRNTIKFSDGTFLEIFSAGRTLRVVEFMEEIQRTRRYRLWP